MTRGEKKLLLVEVRNFVEEFGRNIPGFQADVMIMTAKLADDGREIREFISEHRT